MPRPLNSPPLFLLLPLVVGFIGGQNREEEPVAQVLARRVTSRNNSKERPRPPRWATRLRATDPLG